MAAFEEAFYEDLAYDEAEGEAAMEDEFAMEGLAADEFGDEFEEGFEAEGFDEDSFFEAEGFDEFDAYDEYEGYDAFEEDYAAEEAFDSAMAYALGAEDADEFFGRLISGIRRIAPKIISGIRKAAPMVGRIASGVSRVARLIPHPYAQAIGGAADIVGKAAGLAQRLRMEGASEEEALEAFAELAARDPRALPIVAGITARTILKSKGARMSPAARKQVVKQVKGAAKNLVQKRGAPAIRALPKIAKSVKRSSVVKGVPPIAATKVLRRTAAKVAKSPGLTRKLARPSPVAKRLVGSVAPGGRSYVIPGPTRITISAA
jgi:hypothetical protein